jgi:hypothetical protein
MKVASNQMKRKDIKKNMDWKTVIVILIPAIIALIKWMSFEHAIVEIVKIIFEAIFR